MTSGSPSFPTTHGVIDRVHGHWPGPWSSAQPTAPTGFPGDQQLMVGVGDRPNGGQKGGEHQPDFPGWQFDRHELTVPCDQLGKGAGTSGHDGALTGPQLHAGDDGPQGNLGQRQGIPDFWGRTGSGGYLLAHLQAVLGYDVFLVTIGVFHQGDEGRPIGIVLDRLHTGLDSLFVPFEIDDTVSSFVATAPMAHGHLSLTVPTT